MKKKILIMFGGVSSEHEVSLSSARSVIENIPVDKYEAVPFGVTKDGRCFVYSGPPGLLPDGKWLDDKKNLVPAVVSCDRSHHGIIRLPEGRIERIDAVFPVFHGKNGEDGSAQGLLETAGLPYVGSGVAASALCMDKALSNSLADRLGAAQAKWLSFSLRDYVENKAGALERAAETLGFPMFVKPAGAGSSVGISKVKRFEELDEACKTAFESDDKLVLEEAVVGMEAECAVLGNDEPETFPVCEIISCNEFYDYEAKYLSGESRVLIPARLPEETAEAVKKTAVDFYRAAGCSGLARIDFFVRESDGTPLFNEANTMPGFTPISGYPKMCAAGGIAYPELIDRLIGLAFEK